MEVLLALAEAAQDVVLRDALLERVWGSRAATSDEPLNRCIAQLRRALGDSSRDSEYIQTVPKRGYRLLQTVQPVGSVPEAGTVARPVPGPGPASFGTSRSSRIAIAFAAAIGALALVGYVVRTAELPVSGGFSGVADSSAASTAAPEVRNLILRARDKIAERGADSLHTAIEWLEDAIEIDPAYGQAYVEISRAYALLPSYSSFDDANEAYSSAYEWLIEGLRRDTSIRSSTHGVLAYLYFDRWDWRRAEDEFREALAQTPEDPDMWQWYAHFLAAVGHPQAAADAAGKAWELDPDSPVISDRLAVALLWIDEDEAARARFDEARRRFAGVPSNSDSRIVHFIRDGKWMELEELLIAQATNLVGSRAWIDPLIAHLQRPDDDALLATAVDSFTRAVAAGDVTGKYEFGGWVYLGQTDQAFTKAFSMAQTPRERQVLDTEWLFTRETRFLRRDPRFPELLDAIGLVDYWDESALGWPDFCQRRDDLVVCD